ncbi:hypothetical protein [Holdemanella biformis]|uniref:hypothetical protein n=1 Tax=Holdemanella biformis TaxID=1735 RepID=UPI00249208CD|nr:hypothetical protein [Holdemanella biformis]
MKCDDCKWKDVCIIECDEQIKNCKAYEKVAPLTNGDMIRSMTDEELAKWLNYYAHDGYINPSCGWLKWLKQTVD